MSSLLDKIRTLINARSRGPRQVRRPQAPPAEPPQAPSGAGKLPDTGGLPEVTEGRPRRPKVEVSESTPEPAARQQAPAPKAKVSEKPQPPLQPGELDEGRVADMLKKRKK